MTGDEFYHWLHDSNNYTIKQDTVTGYYCYAVIQNNKLISSSYIVGQINPSSVGLTPGINLTVQQIYSITNTVISRMPARVPLFNNTILSTPGTKTLNNLVVYIRFADDQNSEFPPNQASYSSFFNDSTIGNKSVFNYFKEMSYNQANVLTTFYPTNNGTTIISYKDVHTRNYYLPKSIIISYNPPKYNVDSGYPPNDQNGLYRERREMELIRNALDFIKNQIPSNLNLDIDGDNNIDNICFIIRGNPVDRDSPLYGHKGEYVPNNNYIINSKYVKNYNFVMESEVVNTGPYVLCHEMSHSFGAPDLYHYSEQYFKPVDTWDIMSGINPVSSGAYIKYKYLKWITDIPLITQSGHYTLQPITSATNNCYKVPSSNPNEFFVLEFRQKTGTFESAIPATGLLIYRINTSVNCNSGGDSCGPPDEVYVYRPNGTLINNGNIDSANFDESVGRSIFNRNSNPNCFLSDGSIENFAFKNIEISGNAVSFDVRLCGNSDITLSNTNQLPEVSNAVNTVQTSGSVIVKSTDNITIEAGQEIQLNSGFEVQQGGQLNVNTIQCGN
jgi:M6 family metalloprotease-like protein